MRQIDRVLQRWRMRMALEYVPQNARVIDVGAHEGELFRALGAQLKEGFGVEPLLDAPVTANNYRLMPGFFPAVAPESGGWDAITMLAVLEHIPRSQQMALANACLEKLRDGGRVIVTVPSHAVDYILAALRFLRLIDGMSLEEHFGFDPGETRGVFATPRFELVARRRFQLGLNHLFVFEKRAA